MPRNRRPERLRRRPLGRYRYVRLRWRAAFAVIDCIGAVVFALAAYIRAAVRRVLFQEPAGTSAAAKRGHALQTILLVQLDHLGDAVLSTGMLVALRRRYPWASIEVLASQSNREVFEAAAAVDRVYVSSANRFARGGFGFAARLGWMAATVGWGLRLRLSRPRIDLAIDVRGDFPAAVILWLSGARRRLGWGCGGGGFLLTDRAEFVPGRPEVESRTALLALLDIQPWHGHLGRVVHAPGSPCLEPLRPVFHPSASARTFAADVFARGSEWLPSSSKIVVHVGAGTPAKRWPAEHWLSLVAQLVERHDARVVLVGSGSDHTLAQSIARSARTAQVSDWTGQLSVDQLAAVIEAADVFVGADSGPAHLAAAVDTPAVVLFSGTNHASQWQPCGRAVRVLTHAVACHPCHRTRCPQGDHPCMRGIAPERVAAAVLEMLHRDEVLPNHQESHR